MTPGQQSRRDTTEEMRRQQQADEKIRELEKQARRLEMHCSEYEQALHATYAMLDRYADEVSDEAYRAIECEIMQKTEPSLLKGYKHPLEEEIGRLRDAAQEYLKATNEMRHMTCQHSENEWEKAESEWLEAESDLAEALATRQEADLLNDGDHSDD